ncbi:MAG: glycosyltransferase [Hespellia sp.]|nr:glycosyltransferase [Hespellia sp.]
MNNNNNNMIQKVANSIKNDGIKGCAVRVTKHASRIAKAKISSKEDCKDVLFISGCDERLPHPHRYRVSHQREQLEAHDVTTDEVYYKDVRIEMVRCYRAFVIFRSPYTEALGEFVRTAKELHKTVFYDIDDLVIDVNYTNLIPFVSGMKSEDKAAYDEGVMKMQKMLKMCDAAITSTSCLERELKKYLPKVYINRNTASDQMVELSQDALKQKIKDESVVTIGYFSGSITHNADFEFILPIIIKLLQKQSNLRLQLMGELDIPRSLEKYKNQIIRTPFVKWQKLPECIAAVDINIAPLEKTIFNEAKSENKWIEAALVKVPTIASNLGAFKECIIDGENGILCDSLGEWEEQLEKLILDKQYRKKIGDAAFEYCMEHCTTMKNGVAITKIVQSETTKNCVFVLPGMEISGGVKVALKHAKILQSSGLDVTLYVLDGDESWCEFEDYRFPVIRLRTGIIDTRIDCAVATMWTTVKFVQEYRNIKRRCYLVQNYETDFYRVGDPNRIDANRTYGLKSGMEYLTISKWCQKWLENEFNQNVKYVLNGLDIELFEYVDRKLEDKEKVRILIEGDCAVDYKNVDESFRIVEQLDAEKYEVWYMSYNAKPKKWYRIDKFLHKVPYSKVPEIYKQCDILLKSSLLESFSYPPLEMMATGGYVVVVPNGGNVEYLKDGENCLFYDAGDIQKGKEQIEKIRSQSAKYERLTINGRSIAQERSWNNIENMILELYS